MSVKETHGPVLGADKKISFAAHPLRGQGDDDVTVSIYGGPINPSDTYLYKGVSTMGKQLPVVLGLEGAGLVVDTGKNATHLKGKRVAFSTSTDPTSQGTWGSYTVINSKSVYELPDAVTYDQATMAIVNPGTAVGLIRESEKHGHKSFLAGAASSALAKILLAICKKKGYPFVGLVRKAEYVEPLKKLGADEVLLTTSPDFVAELEAAIAKHKPTAYLDPVGGKEGSLIIPKLPANAITLNYGSLDREPYTIDAMTLRWGNKSLHGFVLNYHLKDPKEGGEVIKEAFALLADGTIKNDIVKTFSAEQYEEAFKYIEEHAASDGKVLFKNAKFASA